MCMMLVLGMRVLERHMEVHLWLQLVKIMGINMYILCITSEVDKRHRLLLLNIKLNGVMFGIDPGARKRDPL